jgi:hypothetical protein
MIRPSDEVYKANVDAAIRDGLLERDSSEQKCDCCGGRLIHMTEAGWHYLLEAADRNYLWMQHEIERAWPLDSDLDTEGHAKLVDLMMHAYIETRGRRRR